MKSSQRTPVLQGPADQLDGTRPAHAGSRRGRIHGERGAAAVEFAIVATLFFCLVFAIIDFGFAFHAWNNTANAAREGARKAAVDSTVQDVIDRTKAAASTLDPTKLTVTVTCSHITGVFSPTICGAGLVEGDVVRVSVDYVYNMITPIGSFVPGLGTSMNLHSQSESRFEGQ